MERGSDIASVLLNLYGFAAMVFTAWFTVVDTLAVYHAEGPVSGMFWFFTVGPLIAALKGALWPIFLCGGCMGFL